MSSPRQPQARGLARRLLTGQATVLLVSVVTAAGVAYVAGPPIFHQHLIRTGHLEDSTDVQHIEEAFRSASSLAMGTGLLVALLCALVATWLLTRRLRRPLDDLRTSARELSRGHYEHRVRATAEVPELDDVAAAFNGMAQRLQEVEGTRRQMLTDLAHELRTPIATLSAYHEGLADGVIRYSPESHAVLLAQTTRLAQLAEDIDTVSTAEEGQLHLQPRSTTTEELIRTAIGALRDRFQDRGVDLVVSPHTGRPHGVSVDERRIGQALSNLLTNALRHTPTGGRVTVSSRRRDGEVTISVTDTGDGLTPEQQTRVFERFYRGDTARARDQSGSGVGLTISKAIADAHGGGLEARSEGLGRGSTFELSLPVDEDSIKNAGPRGHLPEPAAEQRHRRSGRQAGS